MSQMKHELSATSVSDVYNLAVHFLRRTTTNLIMAIGCLAIVHHAEAAEQLREVPGTSFNCTVHPWLEPQILGEQSQAAYAVAEQLGMDVVNISGMQVHWPKSSRSCLIFSGQFGDMQGSGGRPIETSICIGLSDNEMKTVDLGAQRVPGFLSKVAIWPDSRSEDANLIVLASFSEGYEESRVLGFSVSTSGETTQISTSNAHTQWGEFQVADLDDNGTYELLCYRNLDGMLGGISYRSVRGFDPSSNRYIAAAEQHRPFFQREREWLDWVISTRESIVANPTAYLNEEGGGAYYQAQYNGISYGFDSIVFIDNAGYDRETAAQARNAAQEAFRKVRKYRDELVSWLAGGDVPATWGM